jgi:hypothetical protein
VPASVGDARIAIVSDLLWRCLVSCSGGSVAHNQIAACSDLSTLEEVVDDYDGLVKAGRANLGSHLADLDLSKDLTIRFKAVADQLAVDADQLVEFDGDVAASVGALADTVRGQAVNLSLLRGIDSRLLKEEASRVAAQLDC